MITGAHNSNSIGAAIIKHNASHQWILANFDVCDYNIESDFEPFTALVMCHGVTHLDWIEDIPPERIDQAIMVNLTASIHLVQQFVRSTINAPHRKKIISIGSMAHRAVLNGSAAYCASKAGLAHFMRCAAWELAPKGFDVYSIHPSNVQGTTMTEDTIKGLARYRSLTREDAEAYWATGNPHTSALTTDEIARLVGYLLQPGTRYLSGANLELAGGQR
jgi:NAD(P)-dependent dehydrogenase (short-subunit alcohol dehydrogenase family)